jgi:hypothetical protein
VPPRGEDPHQDRDHPAFPAAQPLDQSPDARLDGPGLHGDAQEPADDDDEQRHVDGAEQDPGVVVVDVALLVLDPVEAVDRRGERVDQDPLRVLLHLVIGPRLGGAFLVPVIDPGRHQPHQPDGGQQAGHPPAGEQVVDRLDARVAHKAGGHRGEVGLDGGRDRPELGLVDEGGDRRRLGEGARIPANSADPRITRNGGYFRMANTTSSARR